jgi:hypothetical protein
VRGSGEAEPGQAGPGQAVSVVESLGLEAGRGVGRTEAVQGQGVNWATVVEAARA